MKEVLEHLLRGDDLTECQARELFGRMLLPSSPRERIAGVLAALRAKGEKHDEVRGFAQAMRRHARRPHIDTRDCIDVVGTGGDGSGSLNLSTGVALLTAASGTPVVKHGNRAISSRSGSADVLAELGLTIPLDETAAARMFERTGFTFLFAPHYHPMMAALAPVRAALGIRTIFNILGPLTNPAAPRYYLIGAFSSEVAELLAEALCGMDIERAFVVHGAAGWDEPTPIGPFELYDVRRGNIERTGRDPADFGFRRCTPEDLLGGDAASNAGAIRRVFAGEPGPHRDALLLGAGLAHEVSGRCASLAAGIERAGAAIASGAASGLLERLNRESSNLAEARLV